MGVKQVILLVFFGLIGFVGKAQNPLNKRISVSFSGESTEVVLEKIQELGGFYFSYNSKVVDLNKKVSYKAHHEQVITTLNNIFGKEYLYKHRGNYIIIQKQIPPIIEKKTVVIKGKISDSKDNKSIADVTIYEVDKLKSATTDENGDFNLILSSEKEEVTVLVSKENYKDTVLTANQLSDSNFSVFLTPSSDSVFKNKFFKIDSIGLLKLFYNNKILTAIKNVRLSETRPFQFSLLPFIGTNGKFSGKITNNFSVNLIGGYAYGLKGLELGGAFNVVKDTLRGFQAAGGGNIVGGKVKGTQLSGAFNHCLYTVSGFQASGGANIVKGKFGGVQLGGAFNYCLDSVKGVQASGATNITLKHQQGVQMAGAVNYAKTLSKGGQLAGAFNYSEEIKNGFQISGAVNISKNEIKGLQLSGLLNYTKKLNGHQIGIINVADTVESGVPIGVFSYVKSGLHNFQVSYNDYLGSEFSFRTGVDKFYTLFSLGYYYQNNNHPASYGFGFGKQFNFSSKLLGNIEFSSHQIVNFNDFSPSFKEANLLNKLNLNFGVKLGKSMALLTGPSLNLFVYDKESSIASYDNFTKRKSAYSDKIKSTLINLYMGYQVSFRF